MVTPPSDGAPSIAALASDCVSQIPSNPSAFADDVVAFQTAFDSLLTTVASSDERYMFDRPGRPAAIRAVRGAIPASEAQLFDVILEDLACELAATREALYQIVVAATSRGARFEAP